MIKILFAEDSAVVRKGIVGVLQSQADLEVVGEAENGLIALQLLQNGLPADILLTDFNMPELDGLQLVKQIAKLGLHLPAIMLTMHGNAAFKDQALAAGTRGYLTKNGDMDELVTCIRQVHQGQLFIGKEI